MIINIYRIIKEYWLPDKICLSAAKSHSAGGAKPVSDSLIPANSFTLFNID
jgi:hypothetical protein